MQLRGRFGESTTPAVSVSAVVYTAVGCEHIQLGGTKMEIHVDDTLLQAVIALSGRDIPEDAVYAALSYYIDHLRNVLDSQEPTTTTYDPNRVIALFGTVDFDEEDNPTDHRTLTEEHVPS